MKVFIVGCAKTGTWLLTRLFYAFEDFVLVDCAEERTLSDLIRYWPPPGRHVVMKRTWDEIFSCFDAYGKHEEKRQAVRTHDIKLVYTHRNREDVMASMLKAALKDAKPEDKEVVIEAHNARYDACVQQAEQYGELLTIRVDFARLTSEPNVVQQEVASALGLKIKHLWSEYPDFVPTEGVVHSALGENYSLRPIGAGYSGEER